MPLLPLKPVHPLSSGARVALIAPAGGLRGPEDVDRAVQNAQTLGWEPVVGDHVLERDGYFAGSDPNRLADLNRALGHAAIDGVWCIRGGYGTMRLLPNVDYAALAARPKAVVGFSDATALHAAIQRRCGIISYHGPVARRILSDFTRSSLVRAVMDGSDPCGKAGDARTIRSGRAEGILAGGNLAVLTALAGTPFVPDLRDAILVLEDIDERTYRIDRMLRQLYLSGALRGCRAIAFGECSNCGPNAESGSRTLDEVLAEMANLLDIPCLAGIPMGHIDDQWTFPLGARAAMDADARTLNVEPA